MARSCVVGGVRGGRPAARWPSCSGVELLRLGGSDEVVVFHSLLVITLLDGRHGFAGGEDLSEAAVPLDGDVAEGVLLA